MRIVSLIASATEIVCALDLFGSLVGRSHECDYPEAVAALPAVTEPKFCLDGKSSEIDRRVRSIVSEGLSVYRVDEDRLAALSPTHIVTQDQCEVCAVSLGDVRGAVSSMVGQDVELISLKPDCLEDIFADIARVGGALGVAGRAARLNAALRKRIEDLRARVAAGRAPGPAPGVALIEWIEPLMAAGNWMPEMVELAGGRPLFGEPGKHSPAIDWRQLIESNPDVIIVSPCGFAIERTLAEMAVMTGAPGWDGLAAVRAGRVYIADGNQYFNRPGPRLVDALEILAEIIHPHRLAAAHCGTGWIAYRPGSSTLNPPG